MNHQASEVNALEDALRTAMLTGDVEKLDELIADDLLFIGPDGSVLAKHDDLALYRCGDQRITEIDFQEQQLRMGEGWASVAALTFVSGFFKGRAFQGHFHYLRVWQQTAAGWRVVAGSVSAKSK